MKSKKSAVIALTGLAILAAGFILLKAVPDGGAPKVLAYVCIGLGCGAFGHGMGDFLGNRALKRDPGLARQLEVERGDERNIALANAAKARAFDAALYLFGALMLAFALMQVELAAILLLVAAYLFVAGYSIYWRCRLDKEM